MDATLHVPAASVNLYKETSPWSEFKYIVPIEEEPNDVVAPNAGITNQKFFDLQGRPVQSTPKHGVYVKDGRKIVR